MSIKVISFNSMNYSRTANLMRWSNDGKEIEFIGLEAGWFSILRKLWLVRKRKSKSDVYLVTTGSNVLVPFVRIMGLYPIILDSGWTLSESSRIRKVSKWRRIKDVIIDLASLNFANLILVESRQESDYIAERFRIKKEKMEVSYTGFNEEMLKTQIDETSSSTKSIINAVLRRNYCIFRGKNVEEAGLQLLADSTWYLQEDICILIISNNLASLRFDPRTTVIIEGFLNHELISKLYTQSEFAFGHLGFCDRNERTIPHKVFESSFFGKAIISSPSGAVKDFFGEGNGVKFIEKQDPRLLARIITEVWQDKKGTLKNGLMAKKVFQINASKFNLDDIMKSKMLIN